MEAGDQTESRRQNACGTPLTDIFCLYAAQYLYIFVREPFIKTFMNDVGTFTRNHPNFNLNKKIMTILQRKTDPLKNHSTAQTDSNDP